MFQSNINVTPIGPPNVIDGASPFETKFSYINNTSAPITVVLRSGIKLTLPTQFSLSSVAFTVRVEYHIRPNLQADFKRFITSIGETSTTELKMFKEAFTQQILNNHHGGLRIGLSYSMTLNELKELGGSGYNKMLDILISLEDSDDAPPHPYSQIGEYSTIEDAVSTTNPYRIKNNAILIVDNDCTYGVRYYSFLNEIQKVFPFKMARMKNGIYLIPDGGSDVEENKLNITSDNVVYYPFSDEVDLKLGLFRSRENALNSKTDAAAVMELESAELRHQQLLSELTKKAEISNNQHRQKLLEMENTEHELRQKAAVADSLHKQKLLELETKDILLKEELNAAKILLQQKVKGEKTKDRYEERSYKRKDESEILKIMPTVIMGIAGAFMAFKAFG